MPKGRGRPRGKRSGNVGRHTRNRAAVHITRINEVAEQRTARLETNRLNMTLVRDNETDEQRTDRLETNRLNMTQSRDNETEQEREREHRLETIRLNVTQSRDNETDEQRTDRLETNRLNMTLLRDNETDDQRTDRLETDRFNTAQSRDNDTGEHREHRLQQDRNRIAEVRDEMRSRVPEATARSWSTDPPQLYRIGDRNHPCIYGCKALCFDHELNSALCCSKGKVVLEESQWLRPYPEELGQLLCGQHLETDNFFKYIRNYNSACAFASMGSKAAPPPGHGPYCFRIHGAIYHRSGLLNPESDDISRKFGQIFVLEGDGALQTRLNNNENTRPNVMRIIQNSLELSNPFVSLYRNLDSLEREEISLAGFENRVPRNVRMVFAAGPDRRRYNAPTTDDIAVVFVGDEGNPGRQDFCVYPKASDSLQKIDGRLYTLKSTDYLASPVINVGLNELHELTPENFPVHNMVLKITCQVRLLRPIEQHPEIPVGARLIVDGINTEQGYIVCKYKNMAVTLNRINFNGIHLNSTFIRHQFPIKLESNLETISGLHQSLDPLVYPIFFPSGETGWHQGMVLQNNRGTRSRVSQSQFYSYRLSYREEPFSPLHFGRKLFQQYVVDAWVRTEANRLHYHRTHQKQLRTDLYWGLMDHLENEQLDPGQPQPGRPKILASSFTGSPRYMKQEYGDGMAMCTEMGKPDLFTTFSCNPKHPDIVNNLGNSNLPGSKKLTASDRPDIVAAVFKRHLEELLNDLSHCFGKQLAAIHVIEFQKRGLPHAHILIWLVSESKIRTPEDLDGIVSAEIPDPEQYPELYNIVTSCMMHGPCGTANPNAPCMEDGKCSKNFPKDFQAETKMDVNGYPLYKRTDNGRFVMKNGVPMDNRYVVPYSPFLSLKYGAHINVEHCSSIKSIKYVFKYVYKGHDSARIERTESDLNSRDEITTHIETRYVSAPEAMWRLNGYLICKKSHTIVRLDIHEEHQQMVNFAEGEDIEDVLERDHATKLTAWFDLNERDPSAIQYLYTEIPKHYRWYNKRWVRRKHMYIGEKVIARIYSVSAKQRERFYLRMLLLHVRGARSFRELKIYNDVQYDTYEQVCRERGLLLDDSEWERTLDEAVSVASPKQVRDLFVTILGSCEPTNPIELWEKFKSEMAEDIVFHHGIRSDLAEQYALKDINELLVYNYGVSVTIFGLSMIDNLPDLDDTEPLVDTDSEAAFFQRMYNLMDDVPAQRVVVDAIIKELNQYGPNSCNDRPRVFFIDAPGGTGKTFIFNLLIAYALSKNHKVAACAWTGIAANLLRFGQTAHRLFKLPVPILETSTCNIAPNSKHADFIRSLSLMLVDEASMILKDALNAIDLMLRDITDPNYSVPFGGKLIVFAGDFRQTLPVVPRESPAGIIENCINKSILWQHFNVYHLTKNKRALPGEQEFCEWLIKLGDGKLKSTLPGTVHGQIDIPQEVHKTSSVVDMVYPDFESDRSDCVILTPKNLGTHEINRDTLAKFKPHIQSTVMYSSDKYLENDGNEIQDLSVEFLHSLTPSGLPLHELELKEGCTVILLRNIDSKNGLCNGTRLIIRRIGTRCLDAEIISGSELFIGKRVLIPRIKLSPSENSLPFKFQRTQFPIRLAYCITINKSQGQTFRKVGIYLPEPVFSHGQLYVGFGRARCFDDVCLQIKNTTMQYVTDNDAVTVNVVYDLNQ